MVEETQLTISIGGAKAAGKSAALDLIVAMIEAIGGRRTGEAFESVDVEGVEIAVPAGALAKALEEDRGRFFCGAVLRMKGTVWPTMTVRELRDDGVVVDWFDDHNGRVSSTFHPEQLERVPPAPPRGGVLSADAGVTD